MATRCSFVRPRRPKSCGPAKSGLPRSLSTGSGGLSGDDGVSLRALPGRARSKLEHHRVRNAGSVRRNRGDDTRVLVFIAHEAADALAHPAFRAPSSEGGNAIGFGRPRAVTTTGAMTRVWKTGHEDEAQCASRIARRPALFHNARRRSRPQRSGSCDAPHRGAARQRCRYARNIPTAAISPSAPRPRR